MKYPLLFLISVLLCTYSAYSFQWVKGKFLKPKTAQETALLLQQQAQKIAAGNFWQALKNGANDEAIAIINPAVKNLEAAYPGLKIEMVFMTQNNKMAQNNATLVGPTDGKMPQFQKLFKKGKTNLNQGFQTFSEYFSQNKMKFLCAACIGAYAITQLSLISIKQKLRTNQCWSTWDLHKNIDESSQKLLSEIQNCYCNISNPADFITPLTCFMEDIEEEKYYLKKYAQLLSSLERFHLNRFFLYDHALYSNVQMRIERLAQLKLTFMTWLTEFKVNQVQQNSQKIPIQE